MARKVQFNLLPEVKLQYNRTQQIKKLVNKLAAFAVVISVAVFVLMLVLVNVVQKKQMDSASKAVDKASQKLQAIPNINQIITVRNQLQTLATLHQSKHAAARIFTYLPNITPVNVSINKLDLDLTQNNLTISGTASAQQDVNTFVDTLKQATFTVGSGKATTAFPSVVESAFTINPTNVGYTLSLQFDPTLFANNLHNDQGKTVTPVISVKGAASSSNQSPDKTLFNSTNTSTEGR